MSCTWAGWCAADQLFTCHYLTVIARNVFVCSPIKRFILPEDKDVGFVSLVFWKTFFYIIV